MQVLRTPDACFEGLADYDFAPHYTQVADAERAAYDAPFPDDAYKEGARQFPTLAPITPEHASVAENLAAWKVLEAFDKPFITAFSDGDPVSKGGDMPFQTRVPGAKVQPHVTLHGGHFLQEDCPDAIVDRLDSVIQSQTKA